MDSLIREINENLKAIIDTMKSNLDNSINTLDNIQMQMDKKVEEAKKYKIQVDSAKDKIKTLENDNKALESSLKELSDKYGKLNLVSIVEAGNKEIKTKINDNNREINKQKEHIADLTNKARTIKDLLINLKKDKGIKEEKLENIKIAYEYYSERLNDIMDYAFDHSENLSDYKNKFVSNVVDEEIVVSDNEIENTMVFDEIANIDDNKTFKDEMTFIDNQINSTIENDKIQEIIKKSLENYSLDDNVEEKVVVNNDDIDSTQVFDSIFEEDNVNEQELKSEEITDEYVQIKDETDNEVFGTIENNDANIEEVVEIQDNSNNAVIELDEHVLDKDQEVKEDVFTIKPLENNEEVAVEEETLDNIQKVDEVEDKLNNLDLFKSDIEEVEELDDGEDRISKINDLFNSIDNTKTSNIPVTPISDINNQIDNAYIDVFGQPLDEGDLNKEPTLTDIFGNPIKDEDISEEIKIGKRIEDLFIENGIDFNKFKEDEKNYLKQIYDEDKFINIINTLKRNKINLDNIYEAFNIFGEISANELEGLINKLVNCGQSVEAIGLILEKLPKVKKYNLDETIMGYGDYIKNIDITELIMKAKELHDGGNN